MAQRIVTATLAPTNLGTTKSTQYLLQPGESVTYSAAYGAGSTAKVSFQQSDGPGSFWRLVQEATFVSSTDNYSGTYKNTSRINQLVRFKALATTSATDNTNTITIQSAAPQTTRNVGSLNANTTDQTVSATDNYITGSAIDFSNSVLGTRFKWRFSLTKTATGVVTPQINLRCGTGAVVGDTSRVAVTGAAQTAATDTGYLDIDAIVATEGASGILRSVTKFDHIGGVTGFATLAGPQILQGNSTAFDMTVPSLKLGVSVHPGATGAWTFQTVIAERLNPPPA